MRRSVIAAILMVTAGLAAPAFGGQDPRAAGTREAYTSPGADKTTLVSEPLNGVEGRVVTMNRYAFPAGWTGGKHYHTGPVYVYVLEGSFTVDEQGAGARTFKAGDVYQEPIGTPMTARNGSASSPLKVLVIQVAPKGEPLMIKTD